MRSASVFIPRSARKESNGPAIPPTAFYEDKAQGRFLVRFAFCKRMETLRAGVERLRERLR